MNFQSSSIAPALWMCGELSPAIISACQQTSLPVTTIENCEQFLSQVGQALHVGCLVTNLKLKVAESPSLETPATAIELANRLRSQGCAISVLVVLKELPPHEARDLYHSDICDLLTPFMQELAIREALNNAIHKSVQRFERMQKHLEYQERLKVLTERENDVVKLLCRGKQLKEISALLGVSVQTASKHRARIYRKLKVGNEVELFKNFGTFLEPQEPAADVSRPPNFLQRFTNAADDRF